MGLITLANDSVKTHSPGNNSPKQIAANGEQCQAGINFPAVLIGRLGVSSAYQGKGMRIGSQIIDYVKDWFRSSENKTGCRFIVVDAYNNEKTLHFYERNGFKKLYKTEEEERAFLNLNADEPLATRFMFFDLKRDNSPPHAAEPDAPWCIRAATLPRDAHPARSAQSRVSGVPEEVATGKSARSRRSPWIKKPRKEKRLSVSRAPHRDAMPPKGLG